MLRDEISDDISYALRKTRTGAVLLNGTAKLRSYLDLETIGFEKVNRTLDGARKEKDRVVERLYPEINRDGADHTFQEGEVVSDGQAEGEQDGENHEDNKGNSGVD